ncbi:MAG TPA: YceH family protein [Pyrinomonadaceae bacterium]|nr:YceH family protein [Pyrinomonadaceae bacterium]
MSTILSDIETRVLGSLIEKQVTTPEYYPLTLNALTLACNQKNNRYPVTSYTENQVSDAVERLREKNLAYVFYGSTSRVPKYKHVMPEVMHLNHAEVALMCVLMLRGAQTLGELRGNAARLHDFSGLEEVEQTLNGLITRDEPMVARLPRQPGQKEGRFAHLLLGEINLEAFAEAERAAPVSRRAGLEDKVDALAAEVEKLKEQFEQFRKQFE